MTRHLSLALLVVTLLVAGCSDRVPTEEDPITTTTDAEPAPTTHPEPSTTEPGPTTGSLPSTSEPVPSTTASTTVPRETDYPENLEPIDATRQLSSYEQHLADHLINAGFSDIRRGEPNVGEVASFTTTFDDWIVWVSMSNAEFWSDAVFENASRKRTAAVAECGDDVVMTSVAGADLAWVEELLATVVTELGCSED